MGKSFFLLLIIKLKYCAFDETYSKIVLHAALKALKYLHDDDIIHRNIRPDDILIGRKKDDIRVGDFVLSVYGFKFN